MGEAQIAVLIDFENVGLGSVQPLFDQLSDIGRVIVRRAYADWSKASNKRDQVMQLGIEPVHHFQGTAFKNSSDISLAIDAVDLLYRSPVDTFVIVSSDSDFLALVMKLRAAGKVVIGAGRRDVASKTLIAACDRFIFLGEEEESAKQSEPEKPGRARTPKTTEGRLTGAQHAEAKEQSIMLLLRALQAAMDPDGRVSGSRLYQAMTRIDPSFNYKALGYSTFTQFLENSDEVRIIRSSRGQGDVLVELTSSPPHSDNGDAGEHDDSGVAPGNQSDVAIDEAWDARARETGRANISGPWASERAAKALGAAKLSDSAYPGLQKLLDSSPYLAERWERQGNVLVRRRG